VRPDARVFVAGGRGLVGSAIVRALARAGAGSVLTPTRADVDLRDRVQVDRFMAAEKPSHVFLAAAKVGGIHANNTYRAEFMYDNLAIQNNVIDSAYRHGVEKLLFLGSSCIYPKFADQPIAEEALLTGPLEPTNEPYAIAKIAGMKMCEAYRYQYGFDAISAMPTNLYGPGDNFDLQNSHVIPALMRKAHEAKVTGAPEMTVWGSGTPRREFCHVDDLAEACLFLMDNYDGTGPVNVGIGEDIAIRDLAALICEVVGFQGKLTFDASKPAGTPRKVLDVSRIKALGWTAKIGLKEGLAATYAWYCQSGAAEAAE